MKIDKNTIILEDAQSFSPTISGVDYVDITGTRVHIPMPLLVRLYEGVKFHHENKGINWKKVCDLLFEK